MQYSYLNTAQTGAVPATVLNPGGQAIVIRKILIGNPVASGTITLFNNGNALANNTTSIAYQKTFQGSFTSIQPETVIDFRAATNVGDSTEEDGLTLTAGGTIAISQTMQVTVMWDLAEGN